MKDNSIQFNITIAAEKQPEKSQITEQTKAGFDGEIHSIIMPPGKHGPYYRVDDKSEVKMMEELDAEIEDDQENRLRSIFKYYSKINRTSRIRKFLKDNKINSTPDLDMFLNIEEERIEMDADFSLLNNLKNLIPIEYWYKLDDEFTKTSRGRWLGATKPENFDDADKLYNLNHIRCKKNKYLYEIYFQIPNNIPHLKPILFTGKGKNGTAMQFKFNNHALECISSVTLIDPWN